MEDERWSNAVEFLDRNNGSGWDLLQVSQGFPESTVLLVCGTSMCCVMYWTVVCSTCTSLPGMGSATDRPGVP